MIDCRVLRSILALRCQRVGRPAPEKAEARPLFTLKMKCDVLLGAAAGFAQNGVRHRVPRASGLGNQSRPRGTGPGRELQSGRQACEPANQPGSGQLASGPLPRLQPGFARSMDVHSKRALGLLAFTHPRPSGSQLTSAHSATSSKPLSTRHPSKPCFFLTFVR